ncbi:MAG: hypothetical protein FIA99_10525 [Ruminiclostridium sp.]|nr:hypothetical protein [Ruminiclostridium sp.]
MNQSTKLSVQKGGGFAKTCIIDSISGLNPIKLDYLIDAAIMEWVEAHPEEMDRYCDKDYIWELFSASKVIYL